MSADEPIEIGFLKEQKPAVDPVPEVDDGDDSLSWLAAAFADDDEPLPGASSSPTHAEPDHPPSPDEEVSLDESPTALPDVEADPGLVPDLTVVPDLPELPAQNDLPEALESSQVMGLSAVPDLAELAKLSDLLEAAEAPDLGDLPGLDDPGLDDVSALPALDLSELAAIPGLEDIVADAAGTEDQPESPSAATSGLPTRSMEAIRNRKGFREELLSAFSQIYGR